MQSWRDRPAYDCGRRCAALARVEGGQGQPLVRNPVHISVYCRVASPAPDPAVPSAAGQLQTHAAQHALHRTTSRYPLLQISSDPRSAARFASSTMSGMWDIALPELGPLSMHGAEEAGLDPDCHADAHGAGHVCIDLVGEHLHPVLVHGSSLHAVDRRAAAGSRNRRNRRRCHAPRQAGAHLPSSPLGWDIQAHPVEAMRKLRLRTAVADPPVIDPRPLATAAVDRPADTQPPCRLEQVAEAMAPPELFHAAVT